MIPEITPDVCISNIFQIEQHALVDRSREVVLVTQPQALDGVPITILHVERVHRDSIHGEMRLTFVLRLDRYWQRCGAAICINRAIYVR